MPYFAKCEQTIDAFKFLVSEVIRAEQDFIDTQMGYFVETDYNTYGNVHYAPSPPAEPGTPDGGIALRGNYAGIGFTYNKTDDVFYAPQPYPSWILNAETWLWQAPVPYPSTGGPYIWDEATQSWVPFTG